MADRPPEPQVQAPTPRVNKPASPEPQFSTSGGSNRDDTMKIDPKPGGKPDFTKRTTTETLPGPRILQGDDKEDRGGAKVFDRQNKLIEKYTTNPEIIKALQKAERDSVPKGVNEPDHSRTKADDADDVDDTIDLDPKGLGGKKEVAETEETEEEETPKKKDKHDPEHVAQIAALQEEKQKQSKIIKELKGARTNAKKYELLMKYKDEYPILVGQHFGINVEKLVQDELTGKSEAVKDKIKFEPDLEKDDAQARLVEERDAALKKAAEVEFNAGVQAGLVTIKSYIVDDTSRWELVHKHPEAPNIIMKEVHRMIQEDGLKIASDEEAEKITKDMLDELEEHYVNEGKKNTKNSAKGKDTKSGKRPARPQNQVQTKVRRDVGLGPRYDGPMKRGETVEERQDALFNKYRGYKFDNQ